RAANSFLAATAAASARAAAAPTARAAVAAAGSPRGGPVAVAPAAAVGHRPGSAARKPTSASISRLSAPRVRQTSGVVRTSAPATPKRPFSSGLRAYPRDNRPAGICTIPDTPHFRVDRRASSQNRAVAAAPASDAPAGPASAPRPHVDVARLVSRLSQPRPQHAAAAADAASMLPPRSSRRLPSVPLGRTHGLPVVRRTTTNTTAAAAPGSATRSRSNSAVRAAAAAGGLVQGAAALRADAATEEQQHQE
ncbi:hypothetical protein PMAYCL1PPCAC_00662, partial [Pristionchus mayeri]